VPFERSPFRLDLYDTFETHIPDLCRELEKRTRDIGSKGPQPLAMTDCLQLWVIQVSTVQNSAELFKTKVACHDFVTVRVLYIVSTLL
jgi:hypothetical protein